ncbi:MAG: type III PLP-dependent enzyme [Nitrospiraceae bacterium]|nr:type III PLP-dependent enzyme [Nitrospiraceae bacterium]
MTRVFGIEPFHREIISKSSLLNVLSFLDTHEVETPVLLMDGEQVKRKAAAIGKNIRGSKVFFAVKANPGLEVVRFLAGLGLNFEIASEGELELLARLGVEAGRIITSNPVKTFKFLERAAAYGIKYYAYDSREEVEKLARMVPGAKVYLRLSVPNEGSEWPLSKKFGVEIDEGAALISHAARRGLDPVGITFHVGSQCTNVYNWNNALYKAKILWEIAAGNGINLSVLNIGGGYPVRYTKVVMGIERIEKNIDGLIGELFPPGISVFIEPGRAVVGDAGVFVSRVIGKSRRADEDWLHLDVGVFNGLMESVGGIRYSYIVERNPAAGGGGQSGETDGSARRPWTVAGPSCDSFDVIDTNVMLREPAVGDLVLVLSCGAYTTSYASEFNGFAIPKTLLV